MDEYYTPDEIHQAIERNWYGKARWGARLLVAAGNALGRNAGTRRHIAQTAEGVVQEVVRKLLEPQSARDVGYRRVKRYYAGPDPAERDLDLLRGIIQAIRSEANNIARRAESSSSDFQEEVVPASGASPEDQTIEAEAWAEVEALFEGDEVVLGILRLRREDPALTPRDLAHLLERPVTPDIYRAIERMKARVRRLPLGRS
ncbi:MAG: hypothetical protein AAF624_14790 [Bacteroidota bacterium]